MPLGALNPIRAEYLELCTHFSLSFERNQILKISEIEHFCREFPDALHCSRGKKRKEKQSWVQLKGANIWTPWIKLGDISLGYTMDVVMWISHCLLSDSPSLTLCYPTTHPSFYYWKKHRVNWWISTSFCFYTNPPSECFVWPWPALPGWLATTLHRNNWWKRRWREACPTIWLPKLEGLCSAQ